MAKSTTTFTCQNCGANHRKWMGRCTVCGEWDTLVEESVTNVESNVLGIISVEGGSDVKAISEIDIPINERISSGLSELDRVLGGGFVQDEVILVSGEPGIGKSTLLMQVCGNLASQDKSILYVSGEESVGQISMRARRILDEKSLDKVKLLSNGSVDVIASKMKDEKADFIVVDSIQTIWDESVKALPGGISQVRSAASKLIHAAKKLGVVLIIVGHINKDGKIAGPKVLEHLVDCVMQIEGHRSGEYRVLRSLKNRFGSTGEVGLMQMEENGLVDLSKTDSFLLSEDLVSEVGVAHAVIVEGTRVLGIDIQSLINKTIFPYPKRVSEGVSLSKLQLLSAIAQSLKLASLNDSDVYLRVAGGYSLKDYSYADLAVIASMISSKLKKPFTKNIFFLGEVTLNGRVHAPNMLSKYANEILRLYPNCIVVTSKSLATRMKNKDVDGIEYVNELRKYF